MVVSTKMVVVPIVPLLQVAVGTEIGGPVMIGPTSVFGLVPVMDGAVPIGAVPVLKGGGP